MKKLFTLCLLLLNVLALSAQDLIVTHSGDSINAKITKVKSGYLYFTYLKENKATNALLPPDSVTFYRYDFYQSPAVPASQIYSREEGSNWRVTLNGGWSWRVAATQPGLNPFEKKYIDDLKSGHQAGASVTYFFHKFMGVGLVYDLYFSSNSIYAMAQLQNGTFVNGLLSDKIFVNYIGPSFNLRFRSKKTSNVFLMAGSIGYTDYRDNGSFIDPITITGQTIGISYDIGYDVGVSKHLAIGAELSFRIAALSSYEVTQNNLKQTINLDVDSYESLARVDISLGIRLR